MATTWDEATTAPEFPDWQASVAAARELTRWQIGSARWADAVIDALVYPAIALRRIQAEKDAFDVCECGLLRRDHQGVALRTGCTQFVLAHKADR